MQSPRIIDFRARPASLHEFFGRHKGTARYDRVRWVNERVGSIDAEHFGGERDAAHFVERMREGGISIGVLVSRSIPNCRVENDEVAAICGQFPGEVIGIGAVDPAEGIKNAVAEVERCIGKLGLRGINMDPGLAKIPMPFDDRRCWPVYAACADLGIPVVLMTGPFSGPDISYTHPAGIDRVAKNFPNLSIVAGHACWPYAAEMVGTAFRHSNVFVSPDIYQFQAAAEPYLEAANTFMQDQYLFGSGYPFRPFRQTVDDFLALPWKREVLDKLMFANAARLFKLETK